MVSGGSSSYSAPSTASAHSISSTDATAPAADTSNPLSDTFACAHPLDQAEALQHAPDVKPGERRARHRCSDRFLQGSAPYLEVVDALAVITRVSGAAGSFEVRLAVDDEGPGRGVGQILQAYRVWHRQLSQACASGQI